mgnify:CR=1 FL=1
MKSNLLFFLMSFPIFSFCQNQPPTISNVTFELGANNLLTIQYDLADNEGDPVEITLRASEKGSLLFDYATTNATGDVGQNIATDRKSVV